MAATTNMIRCFIILKHLSNVAIFACHKGLWRTHMMKLTFSGHLPCLKMWCSSNSFHQTCTLWWGGCKYNCQRSTSPSCEDPPANIHGITSSDLWRFYSTSEQWAFTVYIIRMAKAPFWTPCLNLVWPRSHLPRRPWGLQNLRPLAILQRPQYFHGHTM